MGDGDLLGLVEQIASPLRPRQAHRHQLILTILTALAKVRLTIGGSMASRLRGHGSTDHQLFVRLQKFNDASQRSLQFHAGGSTDQQPLNFEQPIPATVCIANISPDQPKTTDRLAVCSVETTAPGVAEAQAEADAHADTDAVRCPQNPRRPFQRFARRTGSLYL